MSFTGYDWIFFYLDGTRKHLALALTVFYNVISCLIRFHISQSALTKDKTGFYRVWIDFLSWLLLFFDTKQIHIHFTFDLHWTFDFWMNYSKKKRSTMFFIFTWLPETWTDRRKRPELISISEFNFSFAKAKLRLNLVGARAHRVVAWPLIDI